MTSDPPLFLIKSHAGSEFSFPTLSPPEEQLLPLSVRGAAEGSQALDQPYPHPMTPSPFFHASFWVFDGFSVCGNGDPSTSNTVLFRSEEL